MAKFKCPKCSRAFSMAAHLGRHVKAMHGRGRKKAAGRTAVSKKRRGPGRPPGRRTTVTHAGVSAARVIGEMEAYRSALVSQRESLDAQISSIDVALHEMGATHGRAGGGRRPTGRGPGRPRKSGAGRPGRPRLGGGFRAGSLKDYIVNVLRQNARAMAPGEIASAVKSAGYKTKATDLTKAVSNALPNLKMVRRARRGFYKMAGR
jgi:hypothetical protein